jgi:copper(I)-binding protein
MSDKAQVEQSGQVIIDGNLAMLSCLPEDLPTMPEFESILPRTPAAAARAAVPRSLPPSVLTSVIAFVLTLVFAPLQAAAQVVTITDPWVRGTVAEQKVTGAFMTLTAPGESRLVEVRSPVAGTVEIHEMKMDGNVMRMRPISALVLPGGKPVELKPGGYHVMLMDLKKPLNAGDMVPLTLTVEGPDSKRQTVNVDVPVRALNATAGTRAQPAKEHKH